MSRAMSRGLSSALTASDGVVISARMSGGLSKGDIDQIAGDRTLTAMLTRWAQNEGKHLVGQAQKLTRRLDLIDTHLLISSYSTKITSDPGSRGLKTRIALENSAPYTMLVHPKGDRKKLVAYHMKASGWLAQQSAEARKTLASLKPRIAQKIANDAQKAMREEAKKAERAAKIAARAAKAGA